MRQNILLCFLFFILVFSLSACASMSSGERKEREEIRQGAKEYYENKYGEKMGYIRKENSTSYEVGLSNNKSSYQCISFTTKKGTVYWDGIRYTDDIQSDKIISDIRKIIISYIKDIEKQDGFSKVIMNKNFVVTSCYSKDNVAFHNFYDGNINDFILREKPKLHFDDIIILVNNGCEYQNSINGLLNQLREKFSISSAIYVFDADFYNKNYKDIIDLELGDSIKVGMIAKYNTNLLESKWYTYEQIEVLEGVVFTSAKDDVFLTKEDVIIEEVNIDKNYKDIIDGSKTNILSPFIYKISVSDKIKNLTGGCLSVWVDKNIWQNGCFYEIENGTNIVFNRSSLNDDNEFSDVSFDTNNGFYCFVGENTK